MYIDLFPKQDMAPNQYFHLVLHYQDNVIEVRNVDPDRYSYLDLVDDVSDTVLSYIPGKGRLEIVNLFVDVVPSKEIVEFNKILEVFEVSDNDLVGGNDVVEGGGVGEGIVVDCDERVEREDGVVEDNEMEDGDEDVGDDFYGFSDEDRDWNEYEDEHEEGDDDDVSLDEEEVSSDDDAISNYQSDDNEGNASDNEVSNAPKRLKANYFDSSNFGKESYLGPQGEVILEEKMIFSNVDAFRAALRDYTMRTGFKLVRDKNEKARVTAHCAAKGCPWRIHASPLPDGITYKIKKLTGEHNCTRIVQNGDATAPWIAGKLLKHFRENPNMGIDVMQEKLLDMYGIESGRSQLYRARRLCIDKLEGNHENQYMLLPTYADIVRQTNPGSLFKIQYDRPSLQVNPTFMRCFISFEAMQWGFKNGCRPFIGSIIGTDEQKPWTIISDQQKGLDKIVAEILPQATHKKCSRHIFCNFKSRFPGLEMRKQFWKAARAYCRRDFNMAMDIIKEYSVDAHEYLSKLEPHEWSKHAFDDRVKSDHITNNFAESFNNWIGKLRNKPILTLLEGIRSKIMCRMQKRYQKALEWNTMATQNINKLMTDLTYASRTCKVAFSGGSELSFDNYVHPYFKKEGYLVTYGRIIHPIMDHTMWTQVPGDVLQPPPLRRQRGRPRKNRRRQEGEAPPGPSQEKRSQTLRCTKCKEFGHNRRTCQGGPVRGSRGRGVQNNVRGRGTTRGGHSDSGGNAIGWTQVDMELFVRGRGRGRGRGRSTSSTARGRGRSTSAPRGRSTSAARGRGRRGSTTSRGTFRGRSSGANINSINEGTRGPNILASQGTQPSQCLTQL
ncbi:hypothetical protein Vadar_010052 [Vaccinium darrowii]|uniref:Uncharacterized protein n=1 Tax=Vaccinium darrowii TaxID=229202 RepID=A0ACB7Z341_9ERIC|nr:hypothetical protein Vadar_010052 [Vaccinium darrowii]